MVDKDGIVLEGSERDEALQNFADKVDGSYYINHWTTLYQAQREEIDHLTAELKAKDERIKQLEAGINNCLDAWRNEHDLAEKEWLERFGGKRMA